ncbi:MAG: AAA family ATPase [Bacteroidetes bacterium]|nr:AAA family ATPase [Bacteroidota bacterium]
MKLTKIEFENYKSFKENQILNLKPITILIGKNNSGKSSIIKLLTLINDSLNSEIEEPILLDNLNSNLGGEFQDLLHKNQPLSELKIKLVFENDISININLVFNSETSNIIISRWEYLNNDINIEINYHPQNKYIDKAGNGYYFKGFIPFNSNTNKAVIEKIILKLDYIGPYRQLPKRAYFLTGQQNFEILGSKGQNAYPLLSQSYLNKTNLILETSQWFYKNLGNWNIKINEISRMHHSITLTNEQTSTNIVDSGQGISQVLPLVVRAFLPTTDNIIIMEQPELHLHPGAHANLAELFVENALLRNQTYIVETHSELFILRLQKLIAESKYGLLPEDVVIYWVDNESPGVSDINEISINKKAQFSDWPPGVFEENIVEISEINKILIKK